MKAKSASDRRRTIWGLATFKTSQKQSLDINPIKHLWSLLESGIRNRPISNKNALRQE